MSTVHVIAVIITNPGIREKVLQIFNENVPAVHAESGCIEYLATIDTASVGDLQTKFGENTFVVIEKWESLDALMAHATSSHMQQYGAKTKDMIVKRTIHVLSST